MPIDYTLVQEGDTFDAAKANAPFTEIATGLNELSLDDIEREALNAQHLRSMWPASFVTKAFAHGPDTQLATEEYRNGLPSSTPAGPVDYQVFSTEAPNQPYGAITGTYTAANAQGWRIVCFDAATATTHKAETTLGGTSLATAGLAGIIARGWLEFRDFDRTFNDGEQDEFNPERRSLLVAIGFQDLTGDRYIIERSVRWYSLKALEFGSASTSTMINASDLAAGDGTISATFFAVAGRKRLEHDALANDPESSGLHIFRYGHSALPLRAGTF